MLSLKPARRNELHYLSAQYLLFSIVGRSSSPILSAEFQATVNTITKKKLPLRTIKLKNLKESMIGELMMFFFLETILFSYLQNEDPFNQPAVEEGKIITKQILKHA